MHERDKQDFTNSIKKNNELIEELVYELEKTKDELRELKDNMNDLKYEMRQIVPGDIEDRVSGLINENSRNNWFRIIFGLICATIFYYIDKNFLN
jgi:cell division protein FtsB